MDEAYRRDAVHRAAFTRADFERRFGNSTKVAELFRAAADSLTPDDSVAFRELVYQRLWQLTAPTVPR